MSDLLEMALEAHGGLALWRQLTAITADMTVGGSLFEMKGQGGTLGKTTMVVDPRKPHATYSPVGMPGLKGIYDGDQRVAIETEAGRLLEQRPSPRTVFADMPREHPWDLLHLMYFCGYAGWNYLTIPFIFTYPGFVTEEITPWEEAGETWRRLKVQFSPDIPTHCPQQTFYFDEKGLLRRQDYEAEVVSSLPTAHYLYDHANFSGLVMPTRRRALRRQADGTSVPGDPFVEIGYSNIRLS